MYKNRSFLPALLFVLLISFFSAGFIRASAQADNECITDINKCGSRTLCLQHYFQEDCDPVYPVDATPEPTATEPVKIITMTPAATKSRSEQFKEDNCKQHPTDYGCPDYSENPANLYGGGKAMEDVFPSNAPINILNLDNYFTWNTPQDNVVATLKTLSEKATDFNCKKTSSDGTNMIICSDTQVPQEKRDYVFIMNNGYLAQANLIYEFNNQQDLKLLYNTLRTALKKTYRKKFNGSNETLTRIKMIIVRREANYYEILSNDDAYALLMAKTGYGTDKHIIEIRIINPELLN